MIHHIQSHTGYRGDKLTTHEISTYLWEFFSQYSHRYTDMNTISTTAVTELCMLIYIVTDVLVQIHLAWENNCTRRFNMPNPSDHTTCDLASTYVYYTRPLQSRTKILRESNTGEFANERRKGRKKGRKDVRGQDIITRRILAATSMRPSSSE